MPLPWAARDCSLAEQACKWAAWIRDVLVGRVCAHESAAGPCLQGTRPALPLRPPPPCICTLWRRALRCRFCVHVLRLHYTYLHARKDTQQKSQHWREGRKPRGRRCASRLAVRPRATLHTPRCACLRLQVSALLASLHLFSRCSEGCFVLTRP